MGAGSAGALGRTRHGWAYRLVDGVAGWQLRPGQRGGASVGLTGKGKGTRRLLVTDAAGIPLGVLIASASTGEVRLAEATLAAIRVPRPRGRPRSRPKQVVADRAYDSRPLRRRLRAQGIRPCIPPKRRPATWKPARGRPLGAFREEYAQRWPVERTFAWLSHQRRLLVRHERLPEVYLAFLITVCALLVLQRLTW